MKAHLQRDFDRRRAVVGVEAAIQSGRRKLQQTLGKFDRRRMREAGAHDVIEFIELGFQRRYNRWMTMTKDVGTPRTDRIELAIAVDILYPDTLCRLNRKRV